MNFAKLGASSQILSKFNPLNLIHSRGVRATTDAERLRLTNIEKSPIIRPGPKNERTTRRPSNACF